ncbi:type 2 lanthipeptide synthetase LanM [Hymenobacter rigui]|uniref:Type 2 lantipeptide synthetase LanM n=1 Tax=Hymenobacter rigui TaxID=334424 RepID=A0A3R9P2X9_9BACT|nr:type 2 lanthipeptide synthetase LanM [Hymenobacter rigui]RSK47570.1 type 2 lantipeptide synthetase LanM [Hymenobacter rigui]
MVSQSPYQIKESYRSIPFVEVVLRYTEGFMDNPNFELSDLAKNKLEYNLLQELSSIAEVILQEELDTFVADGNSSFEEFVGKMDLLLAVKYPVLDRILKLKASNFSKHIHNITRRFREDSARLKSTFNLEDITIKDIDVNLGDGHNGEGTSLVHLSNGTKLIYKPRNINICNSYNHFIEWVNSKLEINLKTFKGLNCNNYGWLEFVNYEEASSEADLQDYYYKAGALLAITLILGSKDCHHENIIASGNNPFVIDHETIIQPFFNIKAFRTWDSQYKTPLFSVLESFLIVDPASGSPLDIVGYGVKGNIEVVELEKKVINPNTINSKRTTRFSTRKVIDKNIPLLRGKYIFVDTYKEHFINGFSATYDMLSDSKDELKATDSPLNFFVNNEVRYVWRPTFVYFKILKYMRSASFMSSDEVYYSALRNLLSKAFREENKKDYDFILDFELKQMVNGDIPIFNLDSSDNTLGGKNSPKIFEYSCLENIRHRVDLLTPEHKEKQLEYILRWINS